MSEHDPLQELVAVQERLNALFEDALSRTNFGSAGVDAWEPTSDLVRQEDGIRIDLELPGLELASIDVRIDGDRLVVSGERRLATGESPERFQRMERAYGRFERAFRLPPEADRDAVEAQYRNGVLTIFLPADGEGEAASLRVEVRS